MQLKAAIFDMDGTLLDSMYIYHTAYRDTLRALGAEPRDDLHDAMLARSGNECIAYLKDEYALSQSLEEIEAALDEQLFDFYSTTPQPKAGVKELLQELYALGIPMCVVTATKRMHVEAALKRTGLLQYFTRIFTCSEENTGKTSPQIFLTAMEFMGTQPRETYVFEDAYHAVMTAKNVGFFVVAIEDDFAAENRKQIKANAHEYYKDFTKMGQSGAKKLRKIGLQIIGTMALLAVTFFVLIFTVFALSMTGTGFVTEGIIIVGALFFIVLASIWGLFKTKTRLIIFAAVIAAALITIGVRSAIRAHEISITVTETALDLDAYLPFRNGTLAASLDAPPSLRLAENLPSLDGATAFFPVYSAFVRATYDEDAYNATFAEQKDGIIYTGLLQCSQTEWAYERLVRDEVDIIFAFAPTDEWLENVNYAYFTVDELKERELLIEFEFTPIGREAFVFFVNAKNGVDSVTSDELRRIYAGEITNWSELGGRNEEILAFQRNLNSGSQTALIKFMGDTPLMMPPRDRVVDAMAGILQRVSNYKNHRNSLGFSFLYYSTEMVAQNDIKLLKIDGVAPTRESVDNGTYPLIYNFYAVTTGERSENEKLLIDWILSPEGQQLVERSGYTAIN